MIFRNGHDREQGRRDLARSVEGRKTRRRSQPHGVGAGPAEGRPRVSRDELPKEPPQRSHGDPEAVEGPVQQVPFRHR